MGGSVCRQVCKRQAKSGDAVDAFADAPKYREPQVPATVASPEECFPKTLEPTLASPRACQHGTPMSESFDAASKGLEPPSEPEEFSTPLSSIHELHYEQVCPMAEPPDIAAKLLPEQDAASVPRSDGSAVEEIPKDAPEEETTRYDTAEEKGAEVERTSSWSLGVSPVQADADDAEAAQGEKEGINESVVQKETKEDMEELPSESPVDAPQERPEEAPEEETTRDDAAEEQGAEVGNISLPWSLSGSPLHEDAKAEAAQREQEGNNESAAQTETKEDNEGSKELAAQKETEDDEDPVSESSSLSAWVASMGADTSAFGTAWSAGLESAAQKETKEEMEEPPSKSPVEVPQETPKEPPEEDTARSDAAEEKGSEVENIFLPWSLSGFPPREDVKAESAKGETGRNSESAAQKETKEDMEELPSEYPAEAAQETPKQAPEAETTRDNPAEAQGAEVENTFFPWFFSGSPLHKDANAESAPGAKEGSNESAAQKETKEDMKELPSESPVDAEETTRDDAAEQKGAEVENCFLPWSLLSPAEAAQETPKDTSGEETTRDNTAEELRSEAEYMFLPWSLSGAPPREDVKAESAKGETGRSSESAAHKKTKIESPMESPRWTWNGKSWTRISHRKWEELHVESPMEAPRETPKDASGEEATRDNTAEEMLAAVENIFLPWSLAGSPPHGDAKAESAKGGQEGNNASAAQTETKESPIEAPQETPKEAPEEEIRYDTAEEKVAEVENIFLPWSLSESPPHEDAKAESAKGEQEGNNASAAQTETKEDNQGSKELEAQKETEDDEDPVSESSSLSAWVASMGADTSAFGTAWSAGLTGLGFAQMTKVGRVIHAMKDAGYSDEKANTVCKALFCKQSEEELKQAFEVFDESKTGAIAGAEFGKLLKLLGEDVPPEKVDDAFKEVDLNNSGKLEYAEFCAVVRLLNPKSAPETGSFLLFGTWWTQEAQQEAPKEEVKKDDAAGKKEDGAYWWWLGESVQSVFSADVDVGQATISSS